ncbi:MAG: formate-dependent phosphoribosylglycinamide formyltransferase (GAR transformylase) [Mariniblastus sp.]|jgi:formate-dependent phosphoribosylglycinamide formyltransferase (GAR transformylase)
MNVIFVEPFFPRNQREFVRGLVQAGATVVAIGETHKDALDDELRGWLYDYIQIPNVCDEAALTQAVKYVQSKMWVDRLEATIESHIMPVAKVRETCTISGISVHTSYLCRDKPAMKQVLREADVACAQSIGSGDAGEIKEFATSVGYPLIVKPRDGAGASATFKVSSDAELNAALSQSNVGRGGEVAVEEFIEGHEGFYDAITIDGQVVFEFVTHYYPNVLEAMRHRWISPQFITTNRVDSVGDYDEVKQMGRKVVEALGIGTSATHMEWFYGPKGLKFSEIGCRPPGVKAWDLYNIANDMDLYYQWALAVTHGQTSGAPSRNFSAGIVALRPDQDGNISGYSGAGEIQERYGEWITDFHLPPEGTPTQGVEAGYMANAYVRMKHPDYDHLRSMLDDVGQTLKVHAK